MAKAFMPENAVLVCGVRNVQERRNRTAFRSDGMRISTGVLRAPQTIGNSPFMGSDKILERRNGGHIIPFCGFGSHTQPYAMPMPALTLDEHYLCNVWRIKALRTLYANSERWHDCCLNARK